MAQTTLAAEHRVCAHCSASNRNDAFLCYNCGNLLQVPPAEKETTVLDESSAFGYGLDQFGENSTLVLRLRGTETAYQLTARQLKLGQIIGRNTAGHSPHAHIDLTHQEGEALGVSRRHMHLSYDSQHQVVKITDMKSANGTFVNGQRLLAGEVRVLRHGDRLRLGKLEIGVTILHAATTIEVF